MYSVQINKEIDFINWHKKRILIQASEYFSFQETSLRIFASHPNDSQTGQVQARLKKRAKL